MRRSAYLAEWDGLDLAARDAAYDNMAAVSGSADLAVKRAARSAAFRATQPDWTRLNYGPSPRRVIDLYPGRKDTPWLLFVHGGYWLRNDPLDFAYVAEGLVRHGWSAAMIGYTLAPAARVGDIADEIAEALHFLAIRRQAAGDTGPVVLAGWSAGATLALLHADHPGFDHVLAISGLYDLGPLRDTSMNTQLRIDEAECARLSPLRRAVPRVPVTLAIGCRELPAIIAATDAMADVLVAARARHEVWRVGGADHFSVLDALAAPDGELARLARSWFAQG